MKKQLLTLSVAAFVFGGSSLASAQHCTVQNGDSLWKIAQRYKIPFEEILKHNAHFKNPHLIFPLDKVELPDHTEHGTSTDQHSKSDNIETGDKKVEQSAPSEQAEAVLALVNQEREKAGLKPLKMSEELRSIANLKARDMAENNYFSHTSPTYGTPFQMLQDFGVHYRAAGENIAAGQRTPEEVMNAWINSSGHRANILNANFDTLGVGVYSGGSYGIYWTQLFTGDGE
ncbi:MAG: LysM peptidoglycan-binding domain-containing protein [Selenomonadaceae bacterium]|nr:LysM peptidoglycan-binding domain-containing protein [Selenomonadaceae bacterium]